MGQDQNTKLFQTSTLKFLKMTERKLSLQCACKTDFCYNVKKTYFFESLMQMKKKTIFTSINKRKIKRLFLYFSRKYEAHKVVFSTKETNLLRRGYRLSFQKGHIPIQCPFPQGTDELCHLSIFVYNLVGLPSQLVDEPVSFGVLIPLV